MARILVVDDSPTARASIRLMLADEGHTVIEAASGQEALDLLSGKLPDLILLDIVMPEIDGIETCRRIRSDPFMTQLPIVFLTAKDRPHDIAKGLDAGGDDFVSKAALSVELLARVRAVLRRFSGGTLDPSADRLAVGGLLLHLSRGEVLVDGVKVELTPVDHRLLYYLMSRAGQPVPTDQLLEHVWEYAPGEGDPKVVHVGIARLRSKIEAANGPRVIHTVRGRGYMIEG
jgi:two-component system OmpR family response regulator